MYHYNSFFDFDRKSIKTTYQLAIAMQFLRLGNPEATKEEKEKYLAYAYELDEDLKGYEYEEVATLLKDRLKKTKEKGVFDLSPKEAMNTMLNYASFSKKEGKRLLWMLVSLSYGDGVFIGEEKEFVGFIAQKYSIKEDILYEFIDCANTLMNLENYDKQIENTSYSYAYVTSLKEQIKRDEKVVTNTLTRLVS